MNRVQERPTISNQLEEPTDAPGAEEVLRSLGIGAEESGKVIRFLQSDGAAPSSVAQRAFLLGRLTVACGRLQNAKLAYSLAARSGFSLDGERIELLAACLDCADCVPAAVRLWKRAVEAGISDRDVLVTAARLGGDGAEQLALLHRLTERPALVSLASELVRRFRAPGWTAEGSWGSVPSTEHDCVWWDGARPHRRQPYGMMLTCSPVSIRNRVGTVLEFECAYEITGVTDRVHLEVSTDGTRWHKVARYEGVADWYTERIDLSDFEGSQLQIRFHVLSGGQRSGRGFELSSPRLLTRPVTCRLQVEFEDLAAGWLKRDSNERACALSGHESEVPQQSVPLSLPMLASPTLGFEGKMVASSVYAKGTIEVLGSDDAVVCALDLTPGSEWRSRTLALDPSQVGQIRVRLNARFTQRREEDGLWVRNLSVYGSDPERVERIDLDGGGCDGEPERLQLLELLGDDSEEKLRQLTLLRRGLPSLQSALALLPLLRDETQAPVLLHLSSLLGPGAVEAFGLLQSLSQPGEDLELQCAVLLSAGVEQYATTRDHLGDGLLTVEEFEANCRLYLSLKESWSEEAAREGLSVLLTPVADETLEQRRARFFEVLEVSPQAAGFFSAWDQAWRNGP